MRRDRGIGRWAATAFAFGVLPAARTDAPIEIPFAVSGEHIVLVAATLNGADAATLALHTAATDVSLTEVAVRKAKSLKFTDAATVRSWGGQARSRCSPGNRLRLGTFERREVRVWENQLAPDGADGKFGLDCFAGKVVEIDFDRAKLTLHDRVPAKAAGWHSATLHAADGEWHLDADCVLAGKPLRQRFLMHTGYAGGVLFDDAFVAAAGLDGKLKIDAETALRDSFGHVVKVKKGVLPALVLGGQEFRAVPAGFFSGGAGRQKQSVLGMDVLRRCNLIVDPPGRKLYLHPRAAPPPANGG